MKRGLYFVAGDSVYDLAVAFLNSLHTSNPDLPVCLIPFGDSTTRLERLAARRGFTVFRDDALLARCDLLGERIHGCRLGHYRKLAAWDGPFDEFIYIDVDTVVLSSLEFVYAYLDEWDFVTSHSGLPVNRQFVWREGAEDAGILTAAQIEFAASTGFMASRRSRLTVERAFAVLERCELLRPYFVKECGEQSFFNALMLLSGNCTSIFALAKADEKLGLPYEVWAADTHWSVQIDGVSTYDGKPTRPMFVHWAGEWQPSASDRRINAVLRLATFGLYRRNIRWRMKNSALWRHFRSLPISPLRHAAPVDSLLDRPSAAAPQHGASAD